MQQKLTDLPKAVQLSVWMLNEEKEMHVNRLLTKSKKGGGNEQEVKSINMDQCEQRYRILKVAAENLSLLVWMTMYMPQKREHQVTKGSDGCCIFNQHSRVCCLHTMTWIICK